MIQSFMRGWLLAFREMGVMAPRSVHARLNINGEFSGVYALTEQIDSQFVEYNFQDKTEIYIRKFGL